MADPRTIADEYAQSAIEYAHQNKDFFLEELIAFSAIPSISTDLAYKAEVDRTAQWVADKLAAIGLDKVNIFPTSGHPVVYGESSKAEGAPTVLIYGHYDVQPAAPLEKWDSNPFKPEVRGDNLYARGATDMKGQVTASINAVEAIVRTSSLPVNVKFIIEGEEEIGSPNLGKFITDHKDLLACDFALNPDTGMVAPDLPTITYALRGLAYFEIRVYGPNQDLHSGIFGGTVHNPGQAICELVAGMHDDQGCVTLPGFYDKVQPLGAEERAEIARLPKGEDWYLKHTGVPALWGEEEYTPEERTGGRPTLEVNGLYSGFIGEGSKTVLPSYAMAKISCRLVPNQDPDEVYEQLMQYMRENAPPSIKWEVINMVGSPPSISDRNSLWAKAYLKAAETVWGVRPAFKREGGSVPVVTDFQQTLGVDVVNMGFGLPSDNMHGPNEKLDLPNWYRGIDALIHFFFNLVEK